MRLHEHPYSGNSHKVRLLMSFLGLDYESVTVDLMTGEQQRAPFIALNPRGEVPVLEDGDVVLRDSSAILVYLAARDEARTWLPEAPAQMAQVMEWLAFAASWIQFGVFSARALVAFGRAGNGTEPGMGSLDEVTLRAKKSLEIMEAQLSDRDWLCGNSPTIADIACFPYVAMAPMGKIALDPYPAVLAWIDRFKTLPGYVTMPGLEGTA